jgi:hypothetical protein
MARFADSEFVSRIFPAFRNAQNRDDWLAHWSEGWRWPDRAAEGVVAPKDHGAQTHEAAGGRATGSSEPTLSEPPDIQLGNGRSSFEGSGTFGTITGGAGPQSVSIEGDAQAVFLARGRDRLEAHFVAEIDMGRGADVVVLHSGAEVVDMGRGRDRLEAQFVTEIDMGRGADVVVLHSGAEVVDMGRGRDRLEFTRPDAAISGTAASDPPTILDGGRGRDTFVTADELGDYDFDFDGDTLLLSDRLTGASAEISGFEQFTFAGRTLSFSELEELFTGPVPNIFASGGTQNVSVNDPDPGVNVVWNRATIEAVIETDLPSGPTIASRAYAMVHTAIYDAWAAFDPVALRIAEDGEGLQNDNAGLAADIAAAGLVGDEAAQEEAMSYAAYIVLNDLFPNQQALFDSVLEGRYGLPQPSAATSLAAQVGLDAGEDLLAQRASDGANQANLYADTTGYVPVNPNPLEINDIERWTPESVPIDPEDADPEQSFLTPHWGEVEGFALDREGSLLQLEKALADAAIQARYGDVSDLDAAPEPFFTPAFAGSTLDFAAREIVTSADSSIGPAGITIPVSKALIGEIINPGFIEQAEIVLEYSASLGDPLNASPNIRAESGDAGKMSAEFYEDGVDTGFPPGTWMVNAEFVAERDALTLGEEALLFLAVGNAVFDAGIATWEAKEFYDYVRPVRAIRDLAELELIGEQGTDYKGDTGQIVWAYIPEIRETGWVLGEEWDTYQTPGGDPSPPFAEYTSGHSAFSAAGAAALRAFTGSDEFGGSVFFPQGSTLFEPGTTPQEDLTIEWATFTDAADAAGLSRLFGGIHFEEGDFNGRALGDYVGSNAFEAAQAYFDGMSIV